MSERRYFKPIQTDDLIERAKPYINKWITVRSWHENRAMKDNYPNDELVGFVKEFCADIPKSELLLEPPK